jgi:SepF-like predicted cell division protein (DUF552 family)
MTPEEIAHMLLRGSSKYKVGLIELLCSDSVSSDEMSAAEELIAQAIRKARIEAYDEAEQIARAHAESLNPVVAMEPALEIDRARKSAAREIADEIHDLKDSLQAASAS